MQQLYQRIVFIGVVLLIIVIVVVSCYLVISQNYIIFSFLVTLTFIVFMYFYRQLRRLNEIKLIIENAVLTISLGQVWSSKDSSILTKVDKDVTVIISVFGILSGNKVYKFNYDGIRLFSMIIDKEFIFLNYGKQGKQHYLKLLHGLTKEDEIQMLSEKFRYETGVIPTLRGW